VGFPAAVAASAAGILAKAGADEGVSIFTRDDVRAILSREADLQTLDAATDGVSLSALGEKVGARWILASVISKVDDDTVIETRLIDVAKAAVATRRLVKASDYGGAFADAVAAGAHLPLSPIFADRQGTIVVKVSEEGADVVIDDEQRGVTPFEAPITLGGGSHLVVVKKEGFIAYRQTVRVEKGSAQNIDVTLRPSADFLEAYKRFNGAMRIGAWSSVVVALGGAGAAGAMGYLFNEQNAETNRINDEIKAGDEGVQIDEEKQSALRADQAKSVQAANGFAAGLSVGAGAAVVGAALAVGFFVFGDDPKAADERESNSPRQREGASVG
jgi:hypothetical protein